MAAITTATYKTYKGISGSTYDAQLDVLVPAVIAQVATYTGRSFTAGTLTEKYDGQDSPILSLRNYPITSITSITITNPQGGSSTVSSNRYGVNLNNGVLKFDPPTSGRTTDNFVTGESPNVNYGYPQDVWADASVFPRGEQNITVVYVVTDGVTADLQLAMYQWIDYVLGQTLIGVGSGAFKHERLGNYDYDRGMMSGNLDYFRALFGPFRRMIG